MPYQNYAGYDGYLTTMAVQARADESESIANLLFPRVMVKTRKGDYKKRDLSAPFRTYETLLARGQSPTKIDVNATEEHYNCKPHALQVGTWEWDQAQDDIDDVREDNLQDLMSAQLITREVEAVQIWKAGIPASVGMGKWEGNDSAKIIEEINSCILAIHKATTKMPNHIVLGLQAWACIQSHPSILARVSGIKSAVTVEEFGKMLITPDIEIHIAKLPYETAPRGKKNGFEYIVGGDVFIFFSQDSPTRDDMSCAKEFVLEGFDLAITSKENEDIMESEDTMRWSSDRHVCNPACGQRIEITKVA